MLSLWKKYQEEYPEAANGQYDSNELHGNAFIVIEGNTPDDLNIVIAALQNALGDAIRVTRGVQSTRRKSPRSKLRYTARLKITV